MEENKIEINDENKQEVSEKKPNKKVNALLVILIVLAIVVTGSIGYVVKLMMDEDKKPAATTKTSVEKSFVTTEYTMTGNNIEKFDLAFLKLENNGKNMVYSPLSIKYGLQMLGEGASGNSKSQIDSILGNYKYRKYNNNSNMSFANAMFIKDSYSKKVKAEYTDNLKTKYNAEVVTDSFKNANTINKWVKNKTFNLIDSIYDDKDMDDMNFALINSLAIDMDWTNAIQCAASSTVPCKTYYNVSYNHEKYNAGILHIEDDYYPSTEFEGGIKAKSVKIGVSVNKYDIVNTLGRENIFNEISKEYKEWLNSDNECGAKDPDYTEEDITKYVNNFIDELDKNYKRLDDSTDFYFEDTDDIKVFAKDLKEYDGSTLQYVGIMPKNVSLSNYIDNIDKDTIIDIISNLKTIELDSFEEGYVTRISGTIPLFKFDYELNLNNDLKALGVTDIFDEDKINLSNMVASNNIVIDTKHKANIEFSNEGIKAAATTSVGGLGNMSCGFEHLYEVPIKEIDLTFDKPYLFLVRDKNSGEVWFIGTVYTPIENTKPARY